MVVVEITRPKKRWRIYPDPLLDVNDFPATVHNQESRQWREVFYPVSLLSPVSSIHVHTDSWS
ncbi:MAG: hypothetical protein ACE5GH_01915, partial [Fidelibacterota bacterium]